jgi:hypothetical protein
VADKKWRTPSFQRPDSWMPTHNVWTLGVLNPLLWSNPRASRRARHRKKKHCIDRTREQNASAWRWLSFVFIVGPVVWFHDLADIAADMVRMFNKHGH